MPTPTLPEQFGRYRILKQLGEGGMGAVYLAEDTQLGRRVALKVPHFAADADPNGLERLCREARAAATLHHPNLCPVHDVGTHDGIPYLTMAYIEGQTLAEAVKTAKPFSQLAAARMVHTLALALAEAHEHGVIHRDLKPANVMIDKRGQPVVMDFGLARLTSTDAARLTGSGALLGTPAYMPPEQVNGDVRAMGPACDIYSLGVILYELLTGNLPFKGSVGAVLGQIVTKKPPPPSAYRPDLDPCLEAICLKAMKKKIEARHASMAGFAVAVGEYLQPASQTVDMVAPSQPVPPSRLQEPDDTQIEPALHVNSMAQRPSATRTPTVSQPRARRSAGRGVLLGCGISAVLGCVAVLGVVVVALFLWATRPAADAANDNAKQATDKLAVTDGPPMGIQGPAVALGDELIRGMHFVRVPKGTFWIGGGSVEGPPTSQVTIEEDFELAAYTVTQGQWETVMGIGSNPSFFSRQGLSRASVADVTDADLKLFPVEMVSWGEVQTFLQKLNEREQGKGYTYRLPKETEWEYACRGAATTREACSFDFYFAGGTNDLSWHQANIDGLVLAGNGEQRKPLQRTTKVGQYPPNKLGLYDMHGNVWQRCEDFFDNTSSTRVVRGGGWNGQAAVCRSACRRSVACGPNDRSDGVGFRIARVPSAS